TFTATLDQINDVLNGLVYTPTPDFDGAGSVSITVHDLGNSGSGGAKSATATIAVDVLPENDPPHISAPLTQTMTEDLPLIFSAANGNSVSIADVDAGSNAVSVVLSTTVGTLTLGHTNGLSFSGGDG